MMVQETTGRARAARDGSHAARSRRPQAQSARSHRARSAPSTRRHRTLSSARGIARLYRDLWTNARGRRVRLVVILLALVVSRLMKLAGPLLFALGLDRLQASSGRSIGPMMLFIVAIAGAMTLYLCFYVPARTAERYLALEVRRLFTDQIYGHLVRLPLGWHAEHHSGELAHRVRSSADALFEFAQSQAFYIQAVATVVGSIGTLLFFNLPTGLIALVGYTVVFTLLVRMDQPLMAGMKTQNDAEASLSAELTDNTGNVATLVTLGLAEHTRKTLRERLTEVVRARRAVIRMQQRKWAMVDGLNELMWCVLVAAAVWSQWLTAGQVTVGTLVLVSQYSREITSAVFTMANHWQQLLSFTADHANVDPVRHAAEDEVVESRLPREWRRIDVQGLSFQYSDDGRGEALGGLHEASLVLRRGERVALVGQSGSGKSTLLRVLAGVYRARSGRVLVDGVALGDARDLRGAATLVPQEPEIFTATVRHNLTVGVEVPPATMRRACDIAQLGPVLDDLPDGLDTTLAERGANLSGGQRQRIALARGLLAARDRPVLLFDEPTSSLDPGTELDLYREVFAEFADACVVSSVHRLHLLPSFDRVVLMDSGRIVDVGSLTELLTRQPVFREMWERAQGGLAAVGESRHLHLAAA